MRRIVLPELLDSLPESSPESIANRRNLLLINGLMGNFRWLRRALLQRLRAEDVVSEWASGDGGFARALHRARLPVRLTGVDVCSQPDNWPADYRWLQKNLLDVEAEDVGSVVLGNFILHQFEDAVLKQLGERLASRARLLIFNETLRSRRALILAYASCWLFRMHPVTKHDAIVSVRAGFRARELSQLLGLSENEWRIEVTTTVRGSYRMIAERTGP